MDSSGAIPLVISSRVSGGAIGPGAAKDPRIGPGVFGRFIAIRENNCYGVSSKLTMTGVSDPAAK
jgi:hypothetical protein